MGLEVMIEQEARKHTEKRGGLMMKFVSPGNSGPPDRIVLHPSVTPFFIEFKDPSKKLEPHQRTMCQRMANHGARIYAGENWEGIRSISVAIQIIDDEFDGFGSFRHKTVAPE